MCWSWVKVYDTNSGATSRFEIDQVFFGSACIDLNEYILVCGGMDRMKFAQLKSCWKIYDRTNYKLEPNIQRASDLKTPRSFGTFSKWMNGDEIILRIHGGFGKNVTGFDKSRSRITRWSMFSNANLNTYEELILNQSNELTIWNRAVLNFTLPGYFYSGYSFFYQNDFYFVTHSNGLFNKSYELFKVNPLDKLESVQVRFW